jgi:hypothetical protein
MASQDIEQRLQAIEDVEAIKNLKNRYCYWCDDNYDADNIASCFTEDGIWDGGSFGSFNGRRAIHKFFADVAPKLLLFAMHMVMNPVIEVKGDTAVGRWYIFEPVTFADGKKAGWLAGYYHDDFVKVKGEWKYKHLRFRQYLSTPFSEPWSNTKFGPG